MPEPMSVPRKSNAPIMRQHNFRIHAPDASEVHIVGDFNNWNAENHGTLTKGDSGWWSICLAVPNRPQHYLFMVDREPRLDPEARGSAIDARLEMRVSILDGGQQ